MNEKQLQQIAGQVSVLVNIELSKRLRAAGFTDDEVAVNTAIIIGACVMDYDRTIGSIAYEDLNQIVSEAYKSCIKNREFIPLSISAAGMVSMPASPILFRMLRARSACAKCAMKTVSIISTKPRRSLCRKICRTPISLMIRRNASSAIAAFAHVKKCKAHSR